MNTITKYIIILIYLFTIVSCEKDEQSGNNIINKKSYRQLSVNGSTSKEVKSPLSKSEEYMEEPLFKEVFSDLPNNDTKAYFVIENNENSTYPKFNWEQRSFTDSDIIMAVTTSTDKKFVKWVDENDANEEFYSFASVAPDANNKKLADMITSKYLISGVASKISASSAVFSLSPVKEDESEYGFKIEEKTETSIKAVISAPVRFVNSQYINGVGKFDFRKMAYIYGSSTIKDLPEVLENAGENKPFSANKITYRAIPAVLRFFVTNQTNNTQYVSNITMTAIDKTTKKEVMLFPTKMEYVLNSTHADFTQVQKNILEKRSGITITFDQSDVDAKRNEVMSSLNQTNLNDSQKKFYYALVLPTLDDNAFNNVNLFFTVSTFDNNTFQYKQYVATLDGANLGGGGYYSNQATNNNKFLGGGIYTFHLSMREGLGEDRRNSLINKFVPPFNVMTNNIAIAGTPREYSTGNVVSQNDIEKYFVQGDNDTEAVIRNDVKDLNGNSLPGEFYIPSIHHYQTIFRGGPGGLNINQNPNITNAESSSRPESAHNSDIYVSYSDHKVIKNTIYSVMLKRLPSDIYPGRIKNENNETYLRSDKYRMAYKKVKYTKDGMDGIMVYSYFLGEFNPLQIDDISKEEFWTNNPFVKELFFQNGDYWTLPYKAGSSGIVDYALVINNSGATGYYTILPFSEQTNKEVTHKLRLFKVLNNN